ncbi:DUF4145 domain-containing protein [Desulfonatronum thioautotrophicum]|uniref:DUF4145 domain-containing protein n=1 Tax=Desulfonatronum thioautotrophicum TaxID=617001 RepID=UPI00137938C2
MELITKKLGANSGQLATRIRDLETKGIVAPWLCGYMHVLRHLGNEAAHENVHGASRVPSVVAPADLIAGLFCVQRQLLDSWEDLKHHANGS